MNAIDMDGEPIGITFVKRVRDVIEAYQGEALSISQLVGSMELSLHGFGPREDEPIVTAQLVNRLDNLIMEYCHKGLTLSEAYGSMRCLQFDIMRTAISELP